MVLSSAVTAYAAGITIPASSAINVNTGTLNVTGDISILTGGTLQASSGTIKLTGNWTNSGTFTSGTGTVEFYNSAASSTISGTTSFCNLTCTAAGKTLNFEADILPNNPETNVTNNLNFTGGSGNPITLARSGGGGTDQVHAVKPGTGVRKHLKYAG